MFTIKDIARAVSAASLSFGLAFAPAVFAQDAPKDTMSKDSMSK